jgi:hypothetical protein
MTSLSQPTARAVQLPQCQKTSILTTAGGFPDNWGSLSAQEQASHPINLPMIQVCGYVLVVPLILGHEGGGVFGTYTLSRVSISPWGVAEG